MGEHMAFGAFPLLEMTSTYSRTVSKTAAILLAAFQSCAISAEEVIIEKPDVRVGDRWTYRNYDPRTGREQYVDQITVTFVSPNVILTEDTRPGDGNDRESTWTSEWNAKALSRTNRVYQPHRDFLKFPIKSGSKYETHYEIYGKGRAADFRIHATVEAGVWEDVIVPAGKFRALRIDVRGTWKMLGGIGSGASRWTYWYVPEVERWVKFSFDAGRESNAEELVEFNLQEAKSAR